MVTGIALPLCGIEDRGCGSTLALDGKSLKAHEVVQRLLRQNHLAVLHSGSMPFRVERDVLMPAPLARTDEPVGA
jgi:hypothetical protein